MSEQIVFVTVGTTKFDALIRALDQPHTVPALAAKGFTKLVIQLGSGVHTPSIICPASTDTCTHANGLKVQWFRFASSLQEHMEAASLIISHAGSGSLFEALGMRKAVIAVPNGILMANHQAELADHLAGLGYLVASTPDKLLDMLQSMQFDGLQPYEPGNPAQIVHRINQLMGISPLF